MRSSSPAVQGNAFQVQVTFTVLGLFALAGVCYLWALASYSQVAVLALTIGVGFFLISFFSIKIGLIVMAIAMLFSPEITVGAVGFQTVGTIGSRPITIRIEDVLIPVLCLAWLARLGSRQESRLFVSSPVNTPIVLLLALTAISTAAGINSGRILLMPAVFYILKTVEFLTIFFLVVNYVRTEEEVREFMGYVLFVLALVGIYTLFQVPTVQIFSERRITAPFEGTPEPGTVGGYMAFLLLIVICIVFYEEKPLMKLLYGLLGALVLIPFIYTLNRTSYIALLGGLFFIAVMGKRKWFLFLLIALLFSSPLWLPPAVKERIAFTWEDAANPGRFMGVDHSLQERVVVYQKMWWSLQQRPLIGWGASSFNHPDSQYANTLHETGLIGICLWAWIFLRIFRMSKWLFDSLEGGMAKGMVLGYRAGVVAILLHCFGSATFYIVRIMEPFWFVTGLIVALYLIRSSKVASAVETR